MSEARNVKTSRRGNMKSSRRTVAAVCTLLAIALPASAGSCLDVADASGDAWMALPGSDLVTSESTFDITRLGLAREGDTLTLHLSIVELEPPPSPGTTALYEVRWTGDAADPTLHYSAVNAVRSHDAWSFFFSRDRYRLPRVWTPIQASVSADEATISWSLRAVDFATATIHDVVAEASSHAGPWHPRLDTAGVRLAHDTTHVPQGETRGPSVELDDC